MDAQPPPSADPLAIPPPPPGMNYIAVIEPALALLLFGVMWMVLMFPLLLLLLAWSTAAARKKPIFVCVTLAVLMGITVGAVGTYAEIIAIIKPLEPMNADFILTYGALIFMIPILVEAILLLRLLAIYPYKQTPRKTFYAIFTPIVLIKLARLTNITVFLVMYSEVIVRSASAGTPAAAGMASLLTVYPGQRIEWCLQLLDNSFCSGLFLWKLRHSHAFRSTTKTSSYYSKIRSLFWIASANFVFPVLLSLVQLIYLFSTNGGVGLLYFSTASGYVQIIGAALASIWAAKGASEPVPGRQTSGATSGSGGSLHFRFGSTQDTDTTHVHHGPVELLPVDGAKPGASRKASGLFDDPPIRTTFHSGVRSGSPVAV